MVQDSTHHSVTHQPPCSMTARSTVNGVFGGSPAFAARRVHAVLKFHDETGTQSRTIVPFHCCHRREVCQLLYGQMHKYELSPSQDAIKKISSRVKQEEDFSKPDLGFNLRNLRQQDQSDLFQDLCYHRGVRGPKFLT